MDLNTLLVAGAVVSLIFGGWNALLQSKMGSLTKLWEWKDKFAKDYGNDRLSDAKSYASRTDLAVMERRIEKRLDDISGKLDELIARGK